MDPEKLLAHLREGPVRITMNHGGSYEVESREMALVSDWSAAVLYRSQDGRLRNVMLPLANKSAVEPVDTKS